MGKTKNGQFMKKAAFLAAWLLFVLTATASTQEEKAIIAGNGNLSKETRNIPEYTGIDVNGPFEIKLVYGKPGPVTLQGESNLLALTTVETKEGKLIIASGNHLLKPSPDKKITIQVPYRRMETITLNGNGSVYAARTLTGETLELVVDGSGTIRLSADMATVKACVIGSGGIIINGRTDNLKCAVAGAGSIKACDLEAESVQALLSGCGTIETNCTQHITGRINGTGSITFSGEPSDTDLKETGGGKFRLY
jgi:hypothetical protein